MKFNLVDEPWLSVTVAGQPTLRLGLKAVMERSDDIQGLAQTQPTALVAEHRLLLAILHRALSAAYPAGWKDKDRLRWYREGLPVQVINDYLEQWRDRFWLFHPDYPFMQVAALATAEETLDKFKPWTQISLASASGNTPVVFDHALDDAPSAVHPADMVSHLLGFMQFTPGGLVQVLRRADKAGALVNTAAVIPLGKTLAQTLMLCLHPASRNPVEPDLPAWERPALTVADLAGEPRPATGPNDRYTRQSRAVLLQPEDDGSVRWLRFAAGLALSDDPNAPDPMACFRAGSQGPVRLTFREGRALWRDLAALVPHADQQDHQAAAVLQRALGLHGLMTLGRVHQPLLIAGMASRDAKLLRWRAERIELPLALLADPDKAQHLCMLVARAESIFAELKKLAVAMLADALPEPTHKDTRNRARSLLDASAFSATYFSRAEQLLTEVLEHISAGQPDHAESVWSVALRQGAVDAWKTVLIGLGVSIPALRAQARHEQKFQALLQRELPAEREAIVDGEALM